MGESFGKMIVVRRAQMVTKPGHRVYYTKHGREVVVLLAGGDKCTQATDINMLQSSRESQGPSQATTPAETRFFKK